MMSPGLMRERRARDTRREMASRWAESQPPALPRVLKQLEGTSRLVVEVDGDIHISVAGAHPLSDSL